MRSIQMRFADLDAVTVDGFGTLVKLESPIAPLVRALSERGVERSHADVSAAFAAEARHYRAGAHTAADEPALASFREECVRVFLGALSAPIDATVFVDAFLAALVFRPAEGAEAALESLRGGGLGLAVVSNWDCSLPARLEELGLLRHFDAVVTSAEAGVPKPDPRPLRLALERLAADAAHALHIGDEQDDELAARAAGMRFAPAPLAAAVAVLE